MGYFVVRTHFSVAKTIVKSIYYVFSSQFFTGKCIDQLWILEKAINQYNEGSLDDEYIVSSAITETPDIQQPSDDAIKANSKTTKDSHM